MNFFRVKPFAAFLLLPLAGCRIFFWGASGDVEIPPPQRTHAVRAFELKKEKRFMEAVEEFRAHIDARTKSPSRPAEENPAFYYLMIGDTYLEAMDPVKAKEAFLAAKADGVESSFVVDRFRQLARWHADRKRYDAAIQTLREVRDLDSLVVDGDIDEYHRLSVAAEDTP
jgi:hypothetical protein